ncbi:hypothetical protein GCM10011492_28500 [Flexivirga endophytica]|uniref:Ferric siderophore reductase C-terminal domain-containing protein n=1 Tax=Flexivirga endophytica TaxID=1849103 RepID=A0A916T8X4_9MICO|nr:(2Fe-2S)-binding protein [Flexivirga endophytica]GGB36089.1 hypothetical protein GCM10011492_28500 [Flexivirga endophytica]GHB43847.1 hypothetical protein GCM10008112_10880 [Flexivirga endophytica]
MNDPHRLGDGLAFAEHSPGATPGSPWQPLEARIGADSLRSRVDHIAAALRSPGREPVDLRTAASTEHFGLVARMIAAHICARALGISVSLTTADIWWQQPPGGLVQLSLTRSPQPRSPLDDSAIGDLASTIQQLFGVSPQVLWGNVGSAANSTLNLLRTARPDLLDDARQAADALLRDARIDGGALHAGPGFRRRSCCLIYRAGTGMCGDCVLRP